MIHAPFFLVNTMPGHPKNQGQYSLSAIVMTICGSPPGATRYRPTWMRERSYRSISSSD
jgi:hypothetical protein